MSLSFIALNCSKDLTFGDSQTEPTFSLIYDLSLIMSENVSDNNGVQSILIRTFHQNTPELRNKIEELITKYSGFNIKIMQLRNYFQQLEADEYFAFCKSETITEARRTDITLKLLALRDGQSLEELIAQHSQSVGDLLQRYEIKGKATSFIQKIGEPDKNKRICRFCTRSAPEVTFKNVAHAIAESLGNKTLILNEECDKCNSDFGSDAGIEKSLITFLKPFITLFGVTGKKGVPKLRGEDFAIEYLDPNKRDEAIQTEPELAELILDNVAENEDEFFDGKFSGIYEADLIWQDLYRTLCKYVLSTMDKDDLKGYDKTISWINRDFNAPSLPKIAVLKNFTLFKKQPSILFYVRKDDDTTLPYTVAEFHQTMFTFVFIIPFAEPDTLDFTDINEYKHFWNTFKHFNAVSGWAFQDASNNNPSKYTVNLNFEQKDKVDEAKR